MRTLTMLLAAVALALVPAATAAAKEDTVTSFDGTQIAVHWFPAQDGVKAPTVLFGPGWGSAGDDNPSSTTQTDTGIVGIGPLRAAGFNVLTWDPRGFGKSGGTVSVDGPDFEGRDVSALIDYVARQPEAELDGPNDPRLGMAGGSYGGGIQLVASALDKRIDVIVPDISWHSLLTSLYKDDTFKTGWASLLSALGEAGGRLDDHIQTAYASGAATGTISAADQAWFGSRGPGDLVKRIHIPTLLVQGTVDTLFTLQEAADNYSQLVADGAPLKMLWFCGGHGACLSEPLDHGQVQQRTIQWLDRYLKGDRSVDTGPAFEWVDQTGKEWAASSYPPAPAAPLEASSDGGELPLSPAGGSGPTSGGTGSVAAISGIANATKASTAVNLTVPAQPRQTLVLGAPGVTFTYAGTGNATRLFGQVVDDATGMVLGNLVTPIPVTLDGAQHSVTRNLEIVDATLPPGHTLTLQIVGYATPYKTAQAPAGAVQISKLRVTLPTVDAAKMLQPGAAAQPARLRVLAARQASPHRARVTLRALPTASHVVIEVRNRAGHVIGTRRLAAVSGTKRVWVRLRRRPRARTAVTITARGPAGQALKARRALHRRRR